MAELICITGIDGVGKSTVIEKLGDAFGSLKVANIWDIIDGAITDIPFKSKKEVDSYLCALTPNSRLLFLAHALKFSVDNALKSDSTYVILNAYIYKYFATELALGADQQLIKSLVELFPVPDKVIYLEISVEEASLRKKYFSRYECGLSSTPNQQGFINFQKKAVGFWSVFNRTAWTMIPASQTLEEIAEQTLAVIKSK